MPDLNHSADVARHDVDPTEVVDLVDEGALGPLKACPDHLTITDVHYYWGGVMLCDTDPKLTPTDSTPAQYTLISFTGHAFPFDPTDVDLLSHLMEQADHDFDGRDDTPYTHTTTRSRGPIDG